MPPTLKHLFLLILFWVVAICEAKFFITSISPSSGHVNVSEGNSFTLKCQTNEYIRGCVWRHKDRSCKLAYSRTKQGLVKNKCLVMQHRVFVVGTYGDHECAIQIQNADLSDAGVWTCEIKEYITRWIVWQSPAIVRDSIDVNVYKRVEKKKKKPLVRDTSIGTRFGIVNGAEEVTMEDPDIEDEREKTLALIVVSSLFGLVVLSFFGLVLFVVARKKGWARRSLDRSKSMRLDEMLTEDVDSRAVSRRPSEAQYEYREPELPQGGASGEELSEKALAQLGVLSYQGSRRVL